MTKATKLRPSQGGKMWSEGVDGHSLKHQRMVTAASREFSDDAKTDYPIGAPANPVNSLDEAKSEDTRNVVTDTIDTTTSPVTTKHSYDPKDPLTWKPGMVCKNDLSSCFTLLYFEPSECNSKESSWKVADKLGTFSCLISSVKVYGWRVIDDSGAKWDE
jgi:hypothetical protein